jgi:hypothetical protein
MFSDHGGEVNPYFRMRQSTSWQEKLAYAGLPIAEIASTAARHLIHPGNLRLIPSPLRNRTEPNIS